MHFAFWNNKYIFCCFFISCSQGWNDLICFGKKKNYIYIFVYYIYICIFVCLTKVSDCHCSTYLFILVFYFIFMLKFMFKLLIQSFLNWPKFGITVSQKFDLGSVFYIPYMMYKHPAIQISTLYNPNWNFSKLFHLQLIQCHLHIKLFWLFSSQNIPPNTKEKVSPNYNHYFPNYHSTCLESWSVEITRIKISGLLFL